MPANIKFIPLIPIFLFWGLYAITRYYRRQKDIIFKAEHFEEKLSKLPLIDRPELKKLCSRPLIKPEPESPKFKLRDFKFRDFFKKIRSIFKKIWLIIWGEIRDWRSIWLFGGMLLTWYFFIYKK